MARPIIGVACRDPDNLVPLQERMLVSEIEAIGPEAARRRGFRYGPWGVSSTLPQPATLEDAEYMRATDETPFPLQLVTIPAELGRTAIANYPPRREGDLLPNPFERAELVPGLIGAILEVRHDRAYRLNVSVDTRYINDVTGRPVYVGDHIDKWPAKLSDILYFGVNAGPGPRYLRITPAVTRDAIGNSNPFHMAHDVVGFIMSRRPEKLKSYWLRLDPPYRNADGTEVMEAYVGNPPAKVLHDGALWGSPLGSTAILGAMDPVSIGVLPSFV